MSVKAEQEKTVLRLWLLLNRVGPVLSLSQDLVYSKYGLTTEQFAVLASLKARGPLRPVDLASLLERSPNTVSMLVDRMVKGGLVRRARDRKDRRAVHVSMTSKGREALEPAFPAGWEFIHKVVSPLSYDEQCALASMLETIKCELACYVNPEMDRREITKKSLAGDPDIYKRMVKNILPAGYEAKRKGGNKKILRRAQSK
jgi:DNA-binding MarR family transcriptional regulator